MSEIKHIIVGGGRLALEDNGITRVSLPMSYMQGSLDRADQEPLWRFADAKQLISGNRAVVIADGEPRGRYREHAERGVTIEAYIRHECEAYRWIITNSPEEMARHAEFFARMMGEMVEYNFLDWGKYVANTNDCFIAVGAAIGSTVDLAWYLKGMYQRHEEMCSGRARRVRAVQTAVSAHRAIGKSRSD